jgi:hypothetical protein
MRRRSIRRSGQPIWCHRAKVLEILASCRQQHGGSVDVETEPEVFTEFKIVLPRASQF